MIKVAPSRSRLVALVAFVVSCVCLLLFLWTSFGGSLPLAARGYRFHIDFGQAVQLADQSDVRISGVSVGKVVSVGLDRATGHTNALLEINTKYAPRPVNTRAILRQKSLLGETFVELSQGTRGAPGIPDGGTLSAAQVSPSVQLDQILSTFDAGTRRAFSTWMQQAGIALTARGEDLNAAVAYLYPFATNVDSVLAVLNRESSATQGLISGGAVTFAALSRSPAELQALIRNSDGVFSATAAVDAALADTFRAFPPFLVSTRQTVARLTAFAAATHPLVNQLRPAARELSPALQALATLAPSLRDTFVALGPLTQASKTGVPAIEHFLDTSVPLLHRLTPYLGGVIPILNYLDHYKRELAAFFANGTAATQASTPTATGENLKYARVTQPINPETVTAYRSRISTSRSNAYLEPGGYEHLINGLPLFGSYLCTSTPPPGIGPTIAADLQQTLQTFYYTSNPNGPPCSSQPPLGSLTTGQSQSFPHLTPIP